MAKCPGRLEEITFCGSPCVREVAGVQELQELQNKNRNHVPGPHSESRCFSKKQEEVQ
jgi:hypothetical protein